MTGRNPYDGRNSKEIYLTAVKEQQCKCETVHELAGKFQQLHQIKSNQQPVSQRLSKVYV